MLFSGTTPYTDLLHGQYDYCLNLVDKISIARQQMIVRHNSHSLNPRLRNKHSIKWIRMY